MPRRPSSRAGSIRQGPGGEGARFRCAAAAAVLAVAAAVCLPLTGCGGSSSSDFPTTIGAARTYRIVDLKPSGPVQAGRPTAVSFQIQQPDGKPLIHFKRGSGPHTGVHLIFVRSDLAYIVHHHPPIDATGTLHDTVVFPAPGVYRAVIDVYPASGGSGASTPPPTPGLPAPTYNFQLFASVRVSGAFTPKPLPPTATADTVDGYRFQIQGVPQLRAIQAAFMTVKVTDPQGRPATFTPWYGALAHAIFFRRGSLDYFHTHVCAPGATGCTSLLGGSRVSGTSATPGKLTVGILVPVSGTWRLFLQCKLGGHVLTAPFTLHVAG